MVAGRPPLHFLQSTFSIQRRNKRHRGMCSRARTFCYAVSVCAAFDVSTPPITRQGCGNCLTCVVSVTMLADSLNFKRLYTRLSRNRYYRSLLCYRFFNQLREQPDGSEYVLSSLELDLH